MKHQKTAKYVDIVKIMLYNVAKGGIMDKKIKMPSKKLSKTFLIVGIILLVSGIVLGVLGVQAHNAAIDEWMDGYRDMPRGMPFYGILGFIGAVVGFGLIFFGLMPYIVKLMAKLHSETMDYAGKEISEASVKAVEVATPAIRKTGEAVAPAVADIVKEVKKADGAVKEDTEKPDKFCPYCGEGLDDEFKFCPKCGKEL